MLARCMFVVLAWLLTETSFASGSPDPATLRGLKAVSLEFMSDPGTPADAVVALTKHELLRSRPHSKIESCDYVVRGWTT
jgi:hypothetical protein